MTGVLSLKEENLAEFKRRFEELSKEMIAPEMMMPQIDVDAELPFHDINNKFLNDLMKFAPFGPENDNPIFVTRNVEDYGTSKLVGKGNIHLKLEMIDQTSAAPVNGIAFRQHEAYSMVKNGRPFDICYTLEENVHNGKTNIQLYIKDIDVNQ